MKNKYIDMIKTFRYIVLGGLLSLLVTGCVSDFFPSGTEGLSDLLVVEGFITDGESTFHISRSIAITDETAYYPPETNVSLMYIECNDGSRTASATTDTPGRYHIDHVSLATDKQYRLYFKLDNGEEYISEFLTPLLTPEIDSISYIKPGTGEEIQICVSTTEEKDQSRYFWWSYVEDWEVWAFLEAEYGLDENYRVYEFEPPYNTYYCWGNDVSKNLLLGSTTNLSTNKIINHTLLEISPYSDKLSVLYHIEVVQHLIRKEAYDYFYNLLKNTDQNSGLFTSMPTEIKGNIRHVSQPEIPVIGYIEVSTTTKATRFIDYLEGLYEFSHTYYTQSQLCFEMETDDKEEALRLNYRPYRYEDNKLKYKPRECVDCRTKYQATKNKPDFWPGDRQ